MTVDLLFTERLDTSHPVDLELGAGVGVPNPVNLLFFKPLYSGHPVDLIFGEEDGETPSGNTSVQFNLTLGVAADFLLDSSEPVTFSIAIPPPYLSMVLSFDNAVTRGLRASVSAPWQSATRKPKNVNLPFEQATKLPVARRTPWTEATPMRASTEAPWQEMRPRVRPLRSAAWDEGTRRRGDPVSAPWEEMDRRKRPRVSTAWQEGTPVRPHPTDAVWQEMTRTSRPVHTAPWGEGTRVSTLRQTLFGQGRPVHADLTAPWQWGRKPPPGRTTITPPEPPVDDPCYVPPPGLAVEVLFDQLWDGTTNLLFICHRDAGPPASIVVPIRRVYMVLNEASLTRVDGGVPIPTYSMSMSLDVDSWTWSFNASVPGEALDTVVHESDGTPIEVEAMVNGMPYRFLVESIQRDRSFGRSRLSLNGRGKSALLDSPYAATQSFYNTIDRTAQQLMGDVLTVSGVPMGWDVEWNLDDWLVPAGVFSQTGSYMAALNAIAGAAGGYIQPHNTDEALSVHLRYPTAPWDWAGVTPDFELPSAVTTRESIAWAEKARYNRVWVSGEAQGILGRVTREGTAGDLPAPMVTDQLITAAAAARQRGISVLGDTGRIATVGLRLPVLEATGIIPPGKMVRYTDGSTIRLGITRSVSVDISMPTIWQQLSVETHDV